MLLVRHGQSEWNASGRWQGRADPPLTDLGRTQALHAARAIGMVDAIYSSPLGRAAETAAIIGAELGVGPVIILEDLQERDAGEFSGLTRAQIDEQYPGFLANGDRPPAWEHDEPLMVRTSAVLAVIAAEVGDGDVLVVTHGGVVMNLEHHLGGGRHRLANLGGRWVDRDGTRFALGDRVELLPQGELTVPDQI
jgi:probable phosphoglycerate mutase